MQIGKILRTAAVIGATMIAVGATATTASADTSPRAYQCHATPAPGVDGVKVHQAMDQGSTVDGILLAGHSLPASCFSQVGNKYSDCGVANNVFWWPVQLGNRWDYVAASCVNVG